MVSDSQTSQDSSGSQIEEPTGPGATSKFLQKWQIDFEPLFTPFLSIPHQNQPYSDLRHTLKYRFLKFWLKTVKSSYVFGRSKRRDVYTPPGAPWGLQNRSQRVQNLSLGVQNRSLGGPKLVPGGAKSVPGGSKSVPGALLRGLGDSWGSLGTS